MIIVKERVKALNLSTLFSWFIIYSYIGWLYETMYCSFTSGKFVNRGFLYGPVCPIYGASILLMILLTGRCRNAMSLFLSCALIASVLEYVASIGMELVYGRRWWDYSDKFLNINGRICLGAAVLFGVCGVVIVRYLHPLIIRYMEHNFTTNMIRKINVCLLALFIFDNLVSIQMSLI
ncbi:MAG: hypothetical protein K0S76_1253 [Herbinix sp.]|jgi:uncharacterized membrane protein|nr:hypothetical protein [Herbinix sp.]